MFILGVLFCNFIYIHENIHAQIAIYHGCKDYNIHYGFIESYFQCDHYMERSEEKVNQEKLLHSWNEIVGYNLQVVITLVIFLVWVINENFKKEN